MSSSEQDPDRCPYCRSSLEIACVKFKISCVVMVVSCPNCAIAFAEAPPEPKLKRLANITDYWQEVMSRFDSLNHRVRQVLAFFIGAVITAAALRHGIHVYGGISPAEMRNDALMAVLAVALAMIVFRRKRQH